MNPFAGDDPIILMLDNTHSVQKECIEIASRNNSPEVGALELAAFVKHEAPQMFISLGEHEQCQVLRNGLQTLKDELSIPEREYYWRAVLRHFVRKYHESTI